MKSIFQVLKYIVAHNRWYEIPWRILSAFYYQIYKRVYGGIYSKTLFNGKKIFLFPDNPISSAFVYAGTPDKKEIAALRDLADANTVFLDIGANIGAYSVLLMDKVKAVYAFEPHPVSAKLCKMNFLLNQANEAHVLELALSDSIEEKYFSNLGGAHPMNSFVASTESALVVQTTTLDAFARQYLDNNTHFILKVDVEGFEDEVFRGAKVFFKEYSVKGVIFETFSDKLHEVIQFFESLNFDIIPLDAHNLLARRKEA